MTLASFHTEVSLALRRGNSVDALIPGWAEDAALWLEQNYSFSYMERTQEAEVVAGDVDSNRIPLTQRFKALDFVRLVSRQDSDVFGYLKKIDAREISSIDAGDPTYYWLSEDDIWMDARPRSNIYVQVRGVFYTDWPEDDDETPTLLRYYKNLLKAQTLIEASIDLKDDRMLQAYNMKFERALQAVLVAEEERKRRGGTSKAMQYSPLGR